MNAPENSKVPYRKVSSSLSSSVRMYHTVKYGDHLILEIKCLDLWVLKTKWCAKLFSVYRAYVTVHRFEVLFRLFSRLKAKMINWRVLIYELMSEG